MKKYIVLLVVVIVLVCSCAADETLEFDDILNDLNHKRSWVSNEKVDINRYVSEETLLQMSAKEYKLLNEYTKPENQQLTKTQALDDIDWLFRLFKYDYGGYGAFGGDESFNDAKERIISKLDQYTEIYTSELETIIVEELSFINDGHFMIGRNRMNEAYLENYYSNEKLAFKKDGKGFYHEDESGKKYLEEINYETSLDSYMKLSFDESGQLVYYIGILKEQGPVIEKISVKYEGDTNASDIDLHRASLVKSPDKATYEDDIINDIPIITLRRCDDLSDETLMQDFVESAEKYKDEEILVIDLRGNSGGTSIWADIWIERYSGTAPERGGTSLLRFGPLFSHFNLTFMEAINNAYLDKYEVPELNRFMEEYLASYQEVQESGSHYMITEKDYQVIDNDHLIFVLIDKGVASSGEDFVIKLKTLNNVIVVGSNTLGCSDVSNIMPLYLPHSRIRLYMGIGLEIKYNEPHFFDGRGFEPDIWIGNSSILERVLTFIGGLNKE